MITRRDLLAVSAVAVAFSAAPRMPRAIAQPLAKTVHILTGFTPGLQDGMGRLIASQMSGYAETIEHCKDCNRNLASLDCGK